MTSVTSELYNQTHVNDYFNQISSIFDVKNEKNTYLSVISEAVDLALKRRKLTGNEMANWKNQLTPKNAKGYDSKVEGIFKQKLNAFTETIEEGIKKNNTTTKIIEFISSTLCDFRKNFPDNDPLEFVLISYLFTRFESPIILIKENELDKFKYLHNDNSKMSSFLADKVREFINYQGMICKRITQGKTKDFYKNPIGGKPIKVEWTDLINSQKKWNSNG